MGIVVGQNLNYKIGNVRRIVGFNIKLALEKRECMVLAHMLPILVWISILRKFCNPLCKLVLKIHSHKVLSGD